MRVSKEELVAVLAQFNPWWRGEAIADLPIWRRAAFRERQAGRTQPPAPRAGRLSGARQRGSTPLLRHVFHTDRWDSVFRYQFPNGRAELRRATIIFRDDRVAAIEADALPPKEDPTDPALPGYRPPASAGKAGP